MLTVLRIKNLGLVADLTLELSPGYNVITGETGAGKSMLIGALNLLLGERADRSLIRSRADSCSVEAIFDTRPVRMPLASFLEENGLEPCEDHQLVLKRICSASGSNRQFVNGSPATLNTLAALGEWLADIHGPHDHQSLLHPARQLAILDAFADLDQERERVTALVQQRASLQAEKASLVMDEKAYAQQLDLLRFQANEIAAARLKPGEDQELEREHHRASNSARLVQLCQGALDLITESDPSLMTQAGALGRTLADLQRVDPAAAPLAELHAQAVSLLQELQTAVSHYADKVEVDPERLKFLEDRLDLLHSLRRKYGSTVAEIIGFGEEAQRRLNTLEQRDGEIARINAELAKAEKELWGAASILSASRRKKIPSLTKAVCRQLSDLGFAQSRLEVDLRTLSEGEFASNPATATATGIDAVEFMFAPNPGEPARPLRAIASSGELARVMLALKTVLAAQDQVPVLVFDEVDANVGGETAKTVGEKLRQIAAKRQVLSITHLPQVAATASAHYLVTKQVKEGRTFTEVALLKPAERVTELARMLGGQTEAARKHAQAMLDTRK